MRASIVDFFFFAFRCLAWVYFSLFHSLRVRGLEHLPRTGPYLIAPNHQSAFDGFLAGFGVPGRVHCVVERPYFSVPVVGWMLRTFRGLPLGGGRDRRGYETVLEKLREGYPVIIFPEGRRSVDGQTLFKLQSGAARIALTLGVPIVPMTLVGVFEALPRESLVPKLFSPIVAKYYPPIPCPVIEDREEMRECIRETNSRLETIYRRRLGAWQRLRK
jgi:1-acyl-sn-glycerol-3-phosphate acyltransferase